MKNRLLHTFYEKFGSEGDIWLYFAPGRVNLIGEHTDYNGGYVFPCALTLGIYGAARKRNDRQIRLYSMNFPEDGVICADLDTLSPGTGWTMYPEGVVRTFSEKGLPVSCGFDLAVCGNLPDGAGLSSSAALEILTGLLLRDLMDGPVPDMKELALLCQYAENHYAATNCGIMDQFTVAMGKEGHAIFLNTDTLQYQYVPVNLQDAAIIIANSRVKHSLAGSAYNTRRQECSAALQDLQKTSSSDCLCDLTPSDFECRKLQITSPVCRKRARHVIYENARTVQAVTALQADDLIRFGQLMNASHTSLRDDYEVSCPEIDLLVDLAGKIPGVLGSRITGGGFGGCTVSIVQQSAVSRFMEEVGNRYQQAVGIRPDFYPVQCGRGAGRLNP